MPILIEVLRSAECGEMILSMRLLIDTLVALMLVAILGGVVMYTRSMRETEAMHELARSELRRFEQQINLHSVLQDSELPMRRHPATIDPAWFGDSLPRNPLLSDDRPWVEIAPPDCRTLQHPPNPVATDSSVAAFWYNPHTGIVRMRVPSGTPDADALALYNAINDCSLTSIFEHSRRE